MDNFLEGLQSAGHLISLSFMTVVHHDATWGFLTGFTMATGFYAVIVSENPRHLPIILTKPPAASFQKINRREQNSGYQVSYTAFQHEYNRVRIVFYVAVAALLAVVAVALLKY